MEWHISSTFSASHIKRSMMLRLDWFESITSTNMQMFKVPNVSIDNHVTSAVTQCRVPVTRQISMRIGNICFETTEKDKTNRKYRI